MNDLIEAKSQEIANTITNFESYLQNIGLPVENVIAPVFDRANVIAGIPSVLATIPASQIDGSVYLSRFVAASSIGLFDAALNYIWNEVIETLRNKVDLYGLDTFFDNCIQDEAKRKLYSNKEDLSGIKDKTLLETLKKLDWISDVIYLKLSHILDMRNQIGASHPNTYNVNGYELLGWLQVCVNEVIASKPSQNAIESKRFLSNIKKMDKPIDQVSLASISNAVSQYPSTLIDTFLKALFGIYTRNATSNITKQNVLSVAKLVWPAANNAPKYEIGEKVPYYRNNLENEMAESVEDFLKEVNGLHYIPISTKSLQIAKLLDDLRDATNGYNNYYTEPPIIKEILNYLGPNIEIPNDQEEKLLAVILHCRTGREVTYCHGVSPSAEPRYEKILKSLSNSQALLCLTLLKDIVPYCYHTGVKEKNVRDILQLIATNQINSRTKEIYNYMANYDKLNLVYKDSKFKQLTQGIIG